VANGGVYSFYDPIATRLPIDPLAADPDQLEAALRPVMVQLTEGRLFLNQAMRCFGVERLYDMFKVIKAYDVTEADRIRCPTLIIDTEGENLLPGQARTLFERLTCPKTFLLFQASEGAGAHCQVGAKAISAQRIFDWLDDVFAGKPVPPTA